MQAHKVVFLALLLGGCATGPSTHDMLMEEIMKPKAHAISPWVQREVLRPSVAPPLGIIQPMPSPGGGYIIY